MQDKKPNISQSLIAYIPSQFEVQGLSNEEIKNMVLRENTLKSYSANG